MMKSISQSDYLKQINYFVFNNVVKFAPSFSTLTDDPAVENKNVNPYAPRSPLSLVP